jgi:hypothetical protein
MTQNTKGETGRLRRANEQWVRFASRLRVDPTWIIFAFFG